MRSWASKSAFLSFLGSLFEVNVLVLIMCILALVAHELVAHYDVHYAQDLREISIWEVHAHNYLATLPFFILLLIIVRRWETFVDFITLNWAGSMGLQWREESLGANGNFAVSYMAVMLVFGVMPYLLEIYRCWKWERDNGVSTCRGGMPHEHGLHHSTGWHLPGPAVTNDQVETVLGL